MNAEAITVSTDAKLLAHLHATSFDDAWSDVFFETMLGQMGVTALATRDGFILMRCVAGEAEVLTLAVDPASRGHGLGYRLVEAGLVLALAHAATRCFLEVAEDNAPAIAIYRKAGFATISERNDYYTRGPYKIRALMMEWRTQNTST
ncbi:MAG: GNAT family N-acetyltransferase [Rhodospirillaceae bacterium]|nr:GNAT family N-acetyltransferase [Rhodospirillaceae bacterium]